MLNVIHNVVMPVGAGYVHSEGKGSPPRAREAPLIFSGEIEECHGLGPVLNRPLNAELLAFLITGLEIVSMIISGFYS